MSKTELSFPVYGVKEYTLPLALPADEWTHLAVALDPANDVHFYVNGRFEGTVPGTAPAWPNSQPFLVGRGAGPDAGLWGYLGGGIDEVAVYGRALEPWEIMEHYVVARGTTQGDTDFDGDVDFGDFNTLANHYTGNGGIGKLWTEGDFNFDGDVDFGDFNSLANHYTGTLKTDALKTGSVPEPSTWALLCVGAVGLLGFVRRRRGHRQVIG